jgi:hypothetical protein
MLTATAIGTGMSIALLRWTGVVITIFGAMKQDLGQSLGSWTMIVMAEYYLQKQWDSIPGNSPVIAVEQ